MKDDLRTYGQEILFAAILGTMALLSYFLVQDISSIWEAVLAESYVSEMAEASATNNIEVQHQIIKNAKKEYGQYYGNALGELSLDLIEIKKNAKNKINNQNNLMLRLKLYSYLLEFRTINLVMELVSCWWFMVLIGLDIFIWCKYRETINKVATVWKFKFVSFLVLLSVLFLILVIANVNILGSSIIWLSRVCIFSLFIFVYASLLMLPKHREQTYIL